MEEGDGKPISKNDFARQGLTWPLTVDMAWIGCEPPELLWLAAKGKRYGLNGMGQIHLELERFDEIWAIDESYPAVPGQDRLKVQPSDLLNEARKLCEKS